MKPALPTPRPITNVIAAMLAATVAFGILTGVATLFQQDGVPLEHLAVAERSGVEQRDACERDILRASMAAGSSGASNAERVSGSEATLDERRVAEFASPAPIQEQ